MNTGEGDFGGGLRPVKGVDVGQVTDLTGLLMAATDLLKVLMLGTDLTRLLVAASDLLKVLILGMDLTGLFGGSHGPVNTRR